MAGTLASTQSRIAAMLPQHLRFEIRGEDLPPPRCFRVLTNQKSCAGCAPAAPEQPCLCAGMPTKQCC